MTDARECKAALDLAEAAMTKAQPDAAPEWLGASSPAHHAGSAMHCLHDLGLHAEAARHSTTALNLPHDSLRARGLHQILLARVQLGLGDVEQSCVTARHAVHAAAALRSRRLHERVREYHLALTPHRRHPAAQQWKAEAQQLLTAA
jgi:hypothetical protein